MFIKKLYLDQRGDSELIDTAIALIFIMGLFVGFFLYSNAAKIKVVMNYATKEGARVYAISKDSTQGIETTNSYLKIGGVSSAIVKTVGDSGMNATNDLNVRVPFFNSGEDLKLVSQFEFFKEFDPKYYLKGSIGSGWLKTPYVKTRAYKDDSTKR